jgi:hypothetical protein
MDMNVELPPSTDDLYREAKSLLFSKPLCAWEKGKEGNNTQGYRCIRNAGFDDAGDDLMRAIYAILAEAGIRDTGLACPIPGGFAIIEKAFDRKIKSQYDTLRAKTLADPVNVDPMDRIYREKAPKLLWGEGLDGWKRETDDSWKAEMPPQEDVLCYRRVLIHPDAYHEGRIIPPAMVAAVRWELAQRGVCGASVLYDKGKLEVIADPHEFDTLLKPKLGQHNAGELALPPRQIISARAIG